MRQREGSRPRRPRSQGGMSLGRRATHAWMLVRCGRAHRMDVDPWGASSNPSATAQKDERSGRSIPRAGSRSKALCRAFSPARVHPRVGSTLGDHGGGRLASARRARQHAILEVHRRAQNDLIAVLQPVPDFDLGAIIRLDVEIADAHVPVLEHGRLKPVFVEDDGLGRITTTGCTLGSCRCTMP